MMITDLAKTYIQEAMNQNGVSTLRVFSGGAGCCGPSYQLALGEPEAGDRIEQINDLQVAYEPEVADQVTAITLDLIQDEQGAGLVFKGASGC
ncbi:adhesin [Saccharibacillus qingshengii]|uniref:adhesin n=1 Tax=Saccharibacillus qingshengii TaxID=1763540 RepID=UPI0015564838|nr:adhesin [Saccharibacillus qingshengii]